MNRSSPADGGESASGDSAPSRHAEVGPRASRTWRRIGDPRSGSVDPWVLVSYNVLAPSLCAKHPHLYGGALRHANWSARSCRLAAELASYRASIYALQEVESVDFFVAATKLDGVVFAPRCDERRDGCAIIFDSTRFSLVSSESLVLDACTSRGEVCALAVLRDRRRDALLVVANVHLLFNPKRGCRRPCGQSIRRTRTLT